MCSCAREFLSSWDWFCFTNPLFFTLLASTYPSLCNELANSRCGHKVKGSDPPICQAGNICSAGYDFLFKVLWFHWLCLEASDLPVVIWAPCCEHVATAALKSMHLHQELSDKKKKKSDLLVQYQLWGSEELPGMLPGYSFWYSLLSRRDIF